MPYSNLKNVKILQTLPKQKQTISSIFSFWGSNEEEEKVDTSLKQNWVAIYHVEFKKWIATNDMNQNGLKEEAKNIHIVGFADSLDSIMFVIWEHQISLGMKHTVLDDIKRNKMLKPNENVATNEEWTGWKGDSKKLDVNVPSQRPLQFEVRNNSYMNLLTSINSYSFEDVVKDEDEEDEE